MFSKFLYHSIYVLLMTVSLGASAENTKQTNLQKKISSVNTTLKKSRAVSKQLKKSVRVAEDKLNSLSRDLHQTARDIRHLTNKLNKSNTHKKKLQKQTHEQKKALVLQMQALYSSNKQSPLRLLLKQDDPSDINRTFKYFEYMNKYRLKRIKLIKVKLNEIQNLQKQISIDTKSLKELQAKQSKKKKVLKSTVKKKDLLVKKQNRTVRSQAQQLSKLKKDESRLRDVLHRLAIKQKNEEKREKVEKQKRKLAKQSKKIVKIIKKASAPVKRRFVPNKAFSSLKGKLNWPVKGPITHKYGSARNSAINWNGVIISAADGTNVHAVARGKVEFSGRLNGYGYVIIIRHDRNYRSLYAYNRSVYKKVGQIVKANEIIAAVGNSGRLASPGLYFEISKGSVHQNPARWCRR